LELLPEAADLRYGSALEAMRVHHDDFSSDTGCYRLPVNRISAATKLPGDEVRDLLRSEAKPCIMAGDDCVKVRWVDFLAAGKQGNALWLALATSDHRGVKDALNAGISAASYASHSGDSERIKTFRSAVDALMTYASYPGDKLKIQQIPGATMSHEGLIGALTERAETHYGRAEGLSIGMGLKAGSCDIVVVCSTVDQESIKDLFGLWMVELLFVESMEELFDKAIDALRMSFGQGWFVNVDRFASAMKKAIRQKQVPNPVLVGDFEDERGNPNESAAAAAGKLCSFGWLPSLWDNREVMLRQASAGSPRAVALSRQFDEELRIFPLPKLALPEEGTLRTDSVQDLGKNTWLNLETWYPQDQVILAIECKRYGARDAKTATGLDAIQKSRFHLLPPFHASSLGLLRQLIPECPFQVLGYSPGGTASTHSGVLERLVTLYRSGPNNSSVASRLLNEIVGLCYPGSVPVSRQSRLDQALSIDCEIAELDAWRASGKPTGSSFHEDASRRPNSLELLLRICSTGKSDPRKALLLACQLVGSILCRKKQSIEPILTSPASPDDNGFGEVQNLNCEIRETFKDDSDVRRSRGADHRILRLYKNLALILWHAVRGRLGLTPSLHAWIAESFRFIWLVPLDHMEPSMAKPPRSGSTYPGSRLSPHFYPHLFSTDEVEGAIPVDLKGLLSRVDGTLALGGNGRKRGWLAHKISETNELMAALMVRIGYVPDFPMESLPLEFKTGKGELHLILARLDSRLIVRCVLESGGGAQFLAEWCEKIARKVGEQAPVASADGDFLANHERVDARFGVFRDCAGLAVAALDCCRAGIRDVKETTRIGKAKKFQVYFRVDKLFEHFRARMIYRSKGTIASDDNDEGEDQLLAVPSDDHDLLAGLEFKLVSLLLAEEFDLMKATLLVRDWEREEGSVYSETPMNLLEGILDDYYPDRNPPKVFLLNCKRLLSHLGGTKSR